MSNLSKNIISKDGPTNDLERLVSNMSGSEYPVEPTFGLGKEIKKIDKDGSSSSGGVFTVRIGDNDKLDKTMGEIQEAWARGDRIDIIDSDGGHHAPIMMDDVHYLIKQNAYTGIVWIAGPEFNSIRYRVFESTEAGALNAYPSYFESIPK